MTDPELFGHPVTGAADLWPPKAMPTSNLADLKATSRRRVSYDWKVFLAAAGVVAIGVALAIAATPLGL